MTGIRSVLAIALCALATSFVAPATQASPPVDAPDGRPCSYAAMTDLDPEAGADAMTGEANGGPLLWDRDFWLHCRLKVNENVHAGSAAVVVHEQRPSLLHDGDSEPDEVALLADEIAYTSPEDAQDYLCTSVSWPTATGPNWRYWHPANDGPDGVPGTIDDVAAHWTPDPNTPCGMAATQVGTGPAMEILPWIFETVVDPQVCLALIQAHQALDPEPSAGPQPGDAVYVDAEGDVFVDDGDGITEDDWRDQLFWDCPGYVDYWSDPWQPGADGYPVIDVGPGPAAALASAVLGYVAVTMSPGDAQPEYTLAGELAVPALWTCSATPYVTTQPYTVTCDPTGAVVSEWGCGVLHADVTTTSAAARARTAIYCDADATPEVKTHTVTGAGGHDSKAGPTLSPVVVTQLRCTVSDGAGAAPVPGFVAGCGDPGAVRVEAEG